MEKLTKYFCITDLKGTTVMVREVDNPNGQPKVMIVKEPCLRLDGEIQPVTVLQEFSDADQTETVSYRTFLNGGEENGLFYPGVLQELVLRAGLTQQTENPYHVHDFEPNWDVIARFWSQPPEDVDPFPSW